MQPTNLLAYVGFALIFAGIIIILLAAILFMFRGAGKTGKASGGGIIFVGPFPIIFGTDRESLKILFLLAIVLFAVTVAFIIGFQTFSR